MSMHITFTEEHKHALSIGRNTAAGRLDPLLLVFVASAPFPTFVEGFGFWEAPRKTDLGFGATGEATKPSLVSGSAVPFSLPELLCEHDRFLKRHLPQRSPGKPEHCVLSLAQLRQAVGIFRGTPLMYMTQPTWVAPALA